MVNDGGKIIINCMPNYVFFFFPPENQKWPRPSANKLGLAGKCPLRAQPMNPGLLALRSRIHPGSLFGGLFSLGAERWKLPLSHEHLRLVGSERAAIAALVPEYVKHFENLGNGFDVQNC